MSKLTIASFDVGYVNFGQYIEEVDTVELENLRNRYKQLSKIDQRKTSGFMNDNIIVLQNDMFTSSKYLDFGVFDLREDKSTKKIDLSTRNNLFKHMRAHYELFEKCDLFIIEQQFFNTFASNGRKVPGGGANIDAIKLGECLYSWIKINFPFKEVEFFSSTYKTQILGAQTKMTKPQRKKWAVEKALEIFTIRGDDTNLLRDTKKKNKNTICDDICDACVQCQAYKFKRFVGEF